MRGWAYAELLEQLLPHNAIFLPNGSELSRGRSAGAVLEFAVATATELVATAPGERPERLQAADL